MVIACSTLAGDIRGSNTHMGVGGGVLMTACDSSSRGPMPSPGLCGHLHSGVHILYSDINIDT